MRIRLFLFMALLFTLHKGVSQTNVYQPWATDSAVWFLEYYPYISSPNPAVYYSRTVWLGDTVINSKTYTKVFSNNGYSSTSYTYTGGVRQDIPNEKLYKIGTSGSEYEVFNNQHLAIGDTFPCFVGTATLTNIDSVLIGTKYHKQYNDTSYQSFAIFHRYIVGFGPVHDASDSYYYNIICYSVDNSVLFGGSPGCPVPGNILGIETFKAQYVNFNVYPNPSTGIFQLAIINELITELKIYDVSGKLVMSQFINGNTTINANSLNEGVYTISLANAEGVANKKLVIIK